MTTRFVDEENFQREIAAHEQFERPPREKDRLIESVFDAVQEGISILDADLTIVRVNRIMREWYSHARPLEGKKCYEAYRGRSEPCPACPTVRALNSGEIEREEVPFIRAHGEAGALELFAHPISNESGRLTGVVEYARDIGIYTIQRTMNCIC